MAGLEAGGVIAAEADPEGGVEVVGGVEGVLAFEDGAAETGDAAGDAVEIGVGRAVVEVRFGTAEDHFPAGGVAGEVVDVLVAEIVPVSVGPIIEFVEVVGDFGADGLEIGAAF